MSVGADGRNGRFVHDDQPDHILAKMRLWHVEDPEVGATLEVDADPDLCNPHGSPHATVLVGLIDCAAASAAVALTGTTNLAGSDVNIRFLDRVRVGPARVLPHVLRAGRRSVVVHVDVVDVGSNRALVATATMAFTRLDS